MRTKLALLGVGLGLLLGAIAPASANIIARGEMNATCDSYTVTFYGDIFLPDESINIDWQIVRRVGGSRYVDTGSTVLLYNDGGTGAQPQKTITVNWATKQCGSIQILTPFEDDGQGSKYSWQSVNNTQASGADKLFIIKPPGDANDFNHFLNCSCTPIVEECRPADFWGSHAGTEDGGSCGKNKSGVNIVQQILDKVGTVSVCGRSINNTNVASVMSAEEALCTPGGCNSDQRVELARQLTATVLGCVMSGGGSTCLGLSVQNRFQQCDQACLSSDSAKYNSCIEDLSCWNNGGTKLGNGMCQIGTCGHDGLTACGGDSDCSRAKDDDDDEEDSRDDGHSNHGGKCRRSPGSCAANALVNSSLALNFDPPGAESSRKSCKSARKNTCTIFSCP